VTPNGFQLACRIVQRIRPVVLGGRQRGLVTIWVPPLISSVPPNVNSVWLLRAYVAGLVGSAALVLLKAQWVVPASGAAFWNVFAALVGLGLLSSAFSLRGRTATSAVSFVPYLASILMVGPSWAMLVAGISEFVSDTLFLRKPLIRANHNTAKEILGVGAAGYLYVALGGSYGIDVFPSVMPALFPAFPAAVAVYFVVSNGASATAVALSSQQPILESWRELVWESFTYNVLSASLSVLLAFLYVELDFVGFLLVIIPLFFLRHAHSVNYKLEQANRDLLSLMVKSIEARDPYTSGHSLRVARTAKLLARAVGMSSKEVDQVETAALLHDVGKIYDEYAPILRKEGRLTDDERMLMETHPIKSAELVATISGLRGQVVQCIRHHHENWDGTGYPDGLAGEEIPLGARIIMIADTVDAMTTDRPYRTALPLDRVLEELRRYRSQQFDPDLVDAFGRNRAIKQLVQTRTGSVEAVSLERRGSAQRAAV
jgi:putative nucleotidyltransferase with HDIG domain